MSMAFCSPRQKRKLRRAAPVVVIGFLAAGLISAICLDVNSASARYRIDAVSSLIGLGATLGTVLLGIVLYQRFGIESSLLERQSQVVFQLAEEIARTRFVISGEGLALQVRMREPLPSWVEKHYSINLLFTTDFFEAYRPISGLADNPFMPRPIADKIHFLRFTTIRGVPQEERPNYFLIRIGGHIGTERPIEGRLNDEDMTLFTFLNYLNEIHEEVHAWIHEYSDYGTRLNF